MYTGKEGGNLPKTHCESTTTLSREASGCSDSAVVPSAASSCSSSRRILQMKDSNNHPHCETDLRTSGKPTGGVSSACTPPPSLPPPVRWKKEVLGISS